MMWLHTSFSTIRFATNNFFWTEVFKNGESLGVFRSWRQAELKTGISRNFIQKAALRGEWKGITIKKSSNRTT